MVKKIPWQVGAGAVVCVLRHRQQQCAVSRAAGGTAGDSSASLHTLPLALQQERGMDEPPQPLWLHPIAAAQVPPLSPQPGLIGTCKVPGTPAAGCAHSRNSAIMDISWLVRGAIFVTVRKGSGHRARQGSLSHWYSHRQKDITTKIAFPKMMCLCFRIDGIY